MAKSLSELAPLEDPPESGATQQKAPDPFATLGIEEGEEAPPEEPLEEETNDNPLLNQPAGDELPETGDRMTQALRKMQSERDKLAQQLKELTPLAQAAAILLQNQGRLPSEAAPPQSEKQGPQPPVAPVRPANFDVVASHSDPTSESFRYREAQEKFLMDRLTYQETLLNQQNEHLKTLFQKEQQEAEARRVEVQLKTQLASKYGLNPQQTEEFLDLFVRSKDEVTLDNFVTLYKVKKGMSPMQKRRVDFGPGLGGGSTVDAGMTRDQALQSSFNKGLQNADASRRFRPSKK